MFDGDETARHSIASERSGYVHVARGRVEVNGAVLEAGDALKTAGGDIDVRAGRGAEVLVFDLPAGVR